MKSVKSHEISEISWNQWNLFKTVNSFKIRIKIQRFFEICTPILGVSDPLRTEITLVLLHCCPGLIISTLMEGVWYTYRLTYNSIVLWVYIHMLYYFWNIIFCACSVIAHGVRTDWTWLFYWDGYNESTTQRPILLQKDWLKVTFKLTSTMSHVYFSGALAKVTMNETIRIQQQNLCLSRCHSNTKSWIA